MFNLEGYNTKDTIAAIATFPSTSSLGVIKISGKDALKIVHSIFVPHRKKDIRKAKTYTLHYGWVAEKGGRENKVKMVDEVIVSVMRKPYSYTREDVVEISSHGGIVVLNKILSLVIKEGARLAKPGEFSYRAWVNGRIDLSQVQAIGDIVEAKTERALFILSQQLKGDFSRRIERLKKTLTDIISHMEAYISFPEDVENFDSHDVAKRLKEVEREVSHFLKFEQSSRLMREGLRCVICGKANVGKSTLFNQLLKEERVLVTHFAGTTRDVIEETINIKGIPLRIYDTAGILEPRDFLDREAMEHSYRKLAEADVVIFVLDHSRSWDNQDEVLLKRIRDKEVIVVVNKVDLKKKLDIRRMRQLRCPLVKTVASKGEGLDELERVIVQKAYGTGVRRQTNSVLLAQWQIDLLRNILHNIEDTLKAIKDGEPLDVVLFSLQPALSNLAKLSGDEISEDILRSIFDRFCIGK